MSDIISRFGKRVKYYRIKQKLSQEKLAELSGLHPTYIGQVERGEKNCTLETAEKIAGGLQMPLTDLIGDFSAEVADKLADTKASDDLNVLIKQLIGLNNKQLTFLSVMIDQMKHL